MQSTEVLGFNGKSVARVWERTSSVLRKPFDLIGYKILIALKQTS